VIEGLGLHPQRTALQQSMAERNGGAVRGTVRRELLDHVVVLSEDHLRRLLREYVTYYNAERVHASIADSPEGRASETRRSSRTRMIRLRAWAVFTVAIHGARLRERADGL